MNTSIVIDKTNPTNGDIMKEAMGVLFPGIEFQECDSRITIKTNGELYYTPWNKQWWKAPYVNPITNTEEEKPVKKTSRSSKSKKSNTAEIKEAVKDILDNE